MDNFSLGFEVTARAHECVRKVTSQKIINLEGGESAYIAVEYKALPTDRNFCFFAAEEVPATLNTLVNARTPRVVLVVNASNKRFTIPKGTKLGHIRENKTANHYTVSFKGALGALAFAAAAASNLVNTGSTTSTRTPTGVEASPEVSFPGAFSPGVSSPETPINLGTEFELNPVTTAIATESAPPRGTMTFDEIADLAIT
ncbi:hypothetical protein F5Y14DRAFT_241643 [Nemania sp. NC0429]|nr:hypothetical protein F5Y14DRAFT_241643 [Nemania sp. NC0429]